MSESYVNRGTGEEAKVIPIPLGAKVTIQMDGPDKQGGFGGLRDQRKFTKAYISAWRSIFEHNLFTPQESHTLLFLGAYCEADSNAVVDVEGRLMTLKTIADGLGWSERNMIRILKSLELKNAIAKGTTMGDDRYFVNPVLFGSGASINKTTQRLFETVKERRIEEAKGMLSFLRVSRSDSTIIVPKE